MNNRTMIVPARIRTGPVVGILVAAIAGVAAGVRWHEPITHLLGLASAHEPASPGATPAAQPKQLWTCSMHPQVIQDHPGLCPICHMELTPLKSAAPTADTAAAGESHHVLTIDPAVVQNMGTRTARVEDGTLHRTIRATGYLAAQEPSVREINLRVSGWIEKLYADKEGMLVEAGQPLFELSSPELHLAIEELIAARHATQTPGADTQTLLDAAARRLEVLGLSPEQVQTLRALDEAPRTVAFLSPIRGQVLDKTIVQGAAVKAGDRVLRVVDLSSLWLEAQVFPADAPLIALHQKATATLASRPGDTLEGEVIFVRPDVDAVSRTALVRMAVPNPGGTLRPGMFATVQIATADVDHAALVPREAVIDTGTRQIAFVALGGGRFEPRDVTMGLEGEGGVVQVLSGLTAGEDVVVSGQFLLDSESRLQESVRKFLSDKPAPAPASGGEHRHQ